MGTHPSGRAVFPAPAAALARRCLLLLLAAVPACTNGPTSSEDDPNFDPTEITVEVKIGGQGGGRVTAPDPVGISCAKPSKPNYSYYGECTETFVDAGAGGMFSLVATPDSASTLAGWSGDCTGQTCTLSFPGYRDTTFVVTAKFNLRNPPTAVIEQPADGASFFADDTVRARGHGIDGAGRRLLGELWTSSIDGTLCNRPDGCTGFNRVLSIGTHVITLRVKDSEGTPGTASITIVVRDEEFNNPPEAIMDWPLDGATLGAGQVRLAGIGFDPEDGRIPEERTVWTSSVDGALGTGWNVFPVLSLGTHVIRLVVTDSGGKSDTASVTITVVANDPPVATITAPSNGQSFDTGTQITFSGTGNDPEEGALTGSALAWTSNVDGTIGTGTSFTRTLSAGSHTITLAATDALGATGTASVDITVADPNPTASISGRVTGNGYAVGGATLTLTGPVSRTVTSNGNGNYSFTQLPAGTYTIRVNTELNINFPSNPRTVTLAQGQSLTVDFAGTY